MKDEDRLKAGIWQYIIDHSFVTHNGGRRVTFVIRDKENFWWRVRARMKGLYSAVNIDEEETMVDELRAHKRMKGFVTYENVRAHQIRQRGTWKEKIMLYAYGIIKQKLFNENQNMVLKQEDKKVGDGEGDGIPPQSPKTDQG